MSPEGTVIPRSAYRGFTSFSFGQKKTPSGFATARLLAVLHRFDDLVGDAATVDVTVRLVRSALQTFGAGLSQHAAGSCRGTARVLPVPSRGRDERTGVRSPLITAVAGEATLPST